MAKEYPSPSKSKTKSSKSKYPPPSLTTLFPVEPPKYSTTKSSRSIDRKSVNPIQQQYSNFSSLEPTKLTSSKLQSKSRSSKLEFNNESASESGLSVLSAFVPRIDRIRGQGKEEKRQTDSPLRRISRYIFKVGLGKHSMMLIILLVVLIKWGVGLGGYSGRGDSPRRGDLEAQRHWLSLTTSVPISSWYFHDPSHWQLDYPPLTAYHSYLIGSIARLSPTSAQYVELRPIGKDLVEGFEQRMVAMEAKGDMKTWMRASVIAGDLIVCVSAVLVYCNKNFGKGKGDKAKRTVMVASLSILLQPSLILIDSGHFQYNSIMLGLTLWSVNLFQSGNDMLGAVLFVCSLGFKQMALYFSPAIFGYLLGKCLWLRGSEGTKLLVKLGITTILSFIVLFSPFLSYHQLSQVLSRIFPFGRGLFEDKVANFWCSINIVIKLRDLMSVGILAKLALLITLLAILPTISILLYISYFSHSPTNVVTEDSTPPTLILLPHSLYLSALAFFLFSFQVHEKSILLPLMPLTLLIGGREVGFGRMDWEWAVLVNNVASFSLWPLLKKDGLGLQYIISVSIWNWAIGYNPFKLRNSFVKYLSIIAYITIFFLHAIEVIATPPAHLPDLFVVFNLTLSAIIFGISFLWASKRLVQEAWAILDFSGPAVSKSIKTVPISDPHSRVVAGERRSSATLSDTKKRREKSSGSVNEPRRERSSGSNFGDSIAGPPTRVRVDSTMGSVRARVPSTVGSRIG